MVNLQRNLVILLLIVVLPIATFQALSTSVGGQNYTTITQPVATSYDTSTYITNFGLFAGETVGALIFYVSPELILTIVLILIIILLILIIINYW